MNWRYSAAAEPSVSGPRRMSYFGIPARPDDDYSSEHINSIASAVVDSRNSPESLGQRSAAIMVRTPGRGKEALKTENRLKAESPFSRHSGQYPKIGILRRHFGI